MKTFPGNTPRRKHGCGSSQSRTSDSLTCQRDTQFIMQRHRHRQRPPRRNPRRVRCPLCGGPLLAGYLTRPNRDLDLVLALKAVRSVARPSDSDGAFATGAVQSGARRRQARAGSGGSRGSRGSRGSCRRSCQLKREREPARRARRILPIAPRRIISTQDDDGSKCSE